MPRPKKKIKNTRVFNNKRYKFWQFVMSKSIADKWSKGQRERGYFARYVTAKGDDGKTYYLIYRRKK